MSHQDDFSTKKHKINAIFQWRTLGKIHLQNWHDDQAPSEKKAFCQKIVPSHHPYCFVKHVTIIIYYHFANTSACTFILSSGLIIVVRNLVVVSFSRREFSRREFSRRKLRNLVVENDKNCLCSFVTVGVP